MPGYRPTRRIESCLFTRDTIVSMLSYASDETIARHTRAPLTYIRKLRRIHSKTGVAPGMSKIAQCDGNGGSDLSEFTFDTRLSSQRLAERIQKFHGGCA